MPTNRQIITWWHSQLKGFLLHSSKVSNLTQIAMNDSEFNQLIEDTLIQLEDILEEHDVDYENQAGILTISCPNGSKIIANKHSGMKQLWLATKQNGHHCEWNGEIWADTKIGTDFCVMLQAALKEQAGLDIKITIEI